MEKQKMLTFVTVEQQSPDKRRAAERKQDFAEIYADYIAEKAREQSSRCSQCGVPFCQSHCPLGNNIPDWLMLTATGRLEEAYELSSATSNMPEICGRICPQDRLCEGGCVIEQSGHGTVTIGAIERYITDTAWDKGWVAQLRPGPDRGQSVGVIGAGPAGLSAAEQLREQGYQVTIYDRHDVPGGLLIYGIPNFKLEKDVVKRRTDRLAAGGITFEMGVDVGVDISFQSLRDRHDAVLVATGVYRARDLEVPGVEADGVHKALDFLIASNRKGMGLSAPAFDSGELDASGKAVVVIGGGDTAMDCVRTAIRQGAKSVTCLYRRDRANMPGSQREVANAEEEGVKYDWLAAPQAVVQKRAGGVKAVRAVRMRLGEPDRSGRQSPQIIAGSEYELKADMVIQALGFDAEDLPARFEERRLEVNRWGRVKTPKSDMMTTLDGVFAAGDIVRGASLVVWAIKEGRDAAVGIDRYLRAKSKAAAQPIRMLRAVN
ncbi:NAD(P)-binding protein [bacterium]|nr:NAD(P)-binding protein [bacterium]